MAYEMNKTYALFSHGGAGRCLTVYGGTANNNQNVCLLRKVGSSAQNWMIKAFGSNLKIVTGINQNYALNYYWSSGKGNPGNCDIYPQSGNDTDSSIVLEPVCCDVYRIKLKNYNLYLTAKGDSDSADVRWERRATASTWEEKELAPQLWRLSDLSAKGIRAPLIFAGYSEYTGTKKFTYEDDQLDGLGNATEFVVCSGVYQGYFNANGEATTALIEYMQAAVSRAKSLYDKYHKQVWIGTPSAAFCTSVNVHLVSRTYLLSADPCGTSSPAPHSSVPFADHFVYPSILLLSFPDSFSGQFPSYWESIFFSSSPPYFYIFSSAFSYILSLALTAAMTRLWP